MVEESIMLYDSIGLCCSMVFACLFSGKTHAIVLVTSAPLYKHETSYCLPILI